MGTWKKLAIISVVLTIFGVVGSGCHAHVRGPRIHGVHRASHRADRRVHRVHRASHRHHVHNHHCGH